MEQRIRVGAVSYLNTKPLIYGIRRSAIMNEIVLTEDHPANVARQLIDDEIDVGLVPVAIIPKLKEHHIIGEHCIGTIGEVASVCVFSDVPLEKVEEVVLDHQSRTSAALTRLLFRKHWQLSPRFTERNEDPRPYIKGTTAGLVIGDRALEQRQHSANIYDLGLAWKDHTGLPFVFAAWVANKPLSDAFIRAFDTANQIGLDHLDEVLQGHSLPCYDLKRYYTENISYQLDDAKRQGLERFLQEIAMPDRT